MIREVFNKIDINHKIIICDDNSPDGTSKIVKLLKRSNIVVIERPGKMGLGSVYIDSIEECKYPYTILMDSDLQHSPFDIERMYKYALYDKYDIVTGTRYNSDFINGELVHGKVSNWSFIRKLQSAIANNLARYILDVKTSDLTGSFRIYKTNVLSFLAKSVYCKNFGFQVEAITRAEHLNLKIKEVPITFFDRYAGESKLGLKEIYKFLMMVVMLYFTI